MAKFKNRHTYIGGSDFGCVCEVNPYKKRIELVLEKAQVLSNQFEGNEATKRGEKLEDAVIEMFEAETGLEVTDKQKEFQIPRSYNCMRLLCHVDGLTSDDCLFEAKTTDVRSKTWNDGIPEYYAKQLEFNCFLAEKKSAYIAVAFCNGDEIVDFKYFVYEPQMTKAEIQHICKEFTKDVKKYKELGVLNTGEILQEDIDTQLIDEYEQLKEQIAALSTQIAPLEKRKKEIEAGFKKRIANAAGIESDLYRITLGNRITAPSFDYKVCRSTLKVEYK